MARVDQSRIDALGGIRIPTGASSGLVAVTDATGNLSWTTVTASGIASGAINAGRINSTLKPSVSALDTDEALRALGKTAGQAASGVEFAKDLQIPKSLARGILLLSTAAVATPTLYAFATYPGASNGIAGNITLFPGNALAMLWIVSGRFPTIAGMTPKLRIGIVAGATNPNPNKTFSAGLYPLTVSTNSWVPGTKVTGSDCVLAVTTASTALRAESSLFDIPTAGIPYAVLGSLDTATPGQSFAMWCDITLEYV